jgi:glycosyltransferase involved in cell wall biosynthesis
MRIAFNLSAVRLAGPQVYSRGILPALVKELRDDEQLLVIGPGLLEDFCRSLPSPGVEFHTREVFNIVPLRMVWEQTALPGFLARHKVDVLFSGYDMSPLLSSCPTVLAIRNPNPISMNQGSIRGLRPRVRSSVHFRLAKASAARAKSVVFPTRSAAELIGPILGIEPEKWRPIHHGLDPEFGNPSPQPSQFPDKLIPRGKYVLFASKFYPQKRAQLLFDAFCGWRKKFGHEDYHLVYCGEEPESERAMLFQQSVAERGLTDRVHLLGIVDRILVRELYHNAGICAMPTVLETFGFPYVEAMAAGVPLVAGDIPIAREVCGDAAWYVPDGNVEAFVDALQGCWDREARGHTEKLKTGRLRAGEFTFQREASDTLRCLREAAGKEAAENR